MTAVCHGCTAIDEVLLSWTYIHHSSDSLHEVIHSLTSFRHGRKSFTIRIKLRFAEYLRNDGVIVLTSENRVYVYGEAVHEIIKSDYDAIDCGENTELFKALAAMMDGPECTEQYLMPTANLYILKRGKIKQLAAKGELLHNDVIVKCGGVFSSLRKAAAEEIVEYFKNKEL